MSVKIALMLDALPKSKAMIANKSYGGDSSRQALAGRLSIASLSTKSNRKVVIPNEPALYPQLHHIAKMVEKLNDWRRDHTRYARRRTHLPVRHFYRDHPDLLVAQQGVLSLI